MRAHERYLITTDNWFFAVTGERRIVANAVTRIYDADASGLRSFLGDRPA